VGDEIVKGTLTQERSCEKVCKYEVGVIRKSMVTELIRKKQRTSVS